MKSNNKLELRHCVKVEFQFLLRQTTTTTTTTNKRDKEQKVRLWEREVKEKNQTVREKLIENLKVGVQIVISFQYII